MKAFLDIKTFLSKGGERKKDQNKEGKEETNKNLQDIRMYYTRININRNTVTKIQGLE